MLELDVSLIVPSLYAGYPSFERFDKVKYQSAIKDLYLKIGKRAETLKSWQNSRQPVS